MILKVSLAYVIICISKGCALNERINSILYERTAISKKPEETIKNDLKLLNEENKMSTDYYIDLLFYHRKLRRLVVIELGASGMHVAEYMTQLPPKELLQGKLHAAIERAREKFEYKEIK